MAAQIKPAHGRLYDQDFCVWAERQAELLRARRFEELDLENLVEEVEDLGQSLERSALDNARIIMEHLLELEYSPAQGPRGGWRASVVEHRNPLELDPTTKLRHIAQAELGDVYRLARRAAEISLRKHGEPAAADALPATCPYTLDRITGDWLP